MEIPFYQVDAFADRIFGGNPAAVMPLQRWLPDETLLAIAGENNQPGNAFFVPSSEDGVDFEIRFFTPTVEVSLSGHTTLSAAFVVLTEITPGLDRVSFSSQSGPVTVERQGDRLALDFPVLEATAGGPADEVAAALGIPPAELHTGLDWMAVLESEAQVRALEPDMARIAALDCRGLMATAPGAACDFVSRFFAPAAGLPEDQVTGSAHCMMTPYWADRLGKAALEARQLSSRGGTLHCEMKGDRIGIAGSAVLFQRGTIRVPGDGRN